MSNKLIGAFCLKNKKNKYKAGYAATDVQTIIDMAESDGVNINELEFFEIGQPLTLTATPSVRAELEGDA